MAPRPEELCEACRRRGSFSEAEIAADLGLGEHVLQGHMGVMFRKKLVAKEGKGRWRWVGG